MSRFLITTADERTWMFDRPVLFLGEWCRRYDRRQVWSALDGVVADPYGVAFADKARDLAFTQQLTHDLVGELTVALNAYHGTTFSRRYWQIVLGHWLRRAVDTLFNRYACVEQALTRHEVSASAFLQPATDVPLATLDSMQFILATNDDRWNSILYARVLADFGITLTGIVSEAGADHVTPHPAPPASLKRTLGTAGARLLSRLHKSTDAFVVHSYLPRRAEIALSILLGQCPQQWRSPAPAPVPASAVARARLSLPTEGHRGVQRFVRAIMPEVLPACFVEGYAANVTQARSLPWPDKPRFIFTSNSFDTDEVFKVWCAAKAEAGRPYFAGQHGNNYGTHFYAGNAHWPERVTADAFFTWGWSDGTSRTVPAFNFKSIKPAPPAPRAGGLLLVEECLNHRITPWDGYFEFGQYQEQQFRFVAALPAAIRDAVTVRLHREWAIHAWFDRDRWHDREPQIRLETGERSMDELIAGSRLVVHSYESTGVLENFTRNIPTLCFWSAGLDHVIAEARPFYDRLVDAGVIVTSADRAAALVAERWDGIHDWWHSPLVQGAVRDYCQRFSRREDRPVRTLRRLLLNQLHPVEVPA